MSNIKCLKQATTGQLFAYTDEMAQRPDMLPYDGPPNTGQSVDVLQSQQTLLDNRAANDRKVEQLLRQHQGELDQANVNSARERKAFEDENAKLRAQIAAMEAGQAPAVPAAPAATLAPPPENMQIVGTQDAQLYNPAAQSANPEPAQSNWAVPEGAEVLEHTTSPVVVPAAAPATPAAVPPVAQPVAAPIAQAPAPVLPAAAAGVAAMM